MTTIQHRTALLQTVPRDELLIHEIYRSVQGESTFAGLPCVFVRTSVCDLRCRWCDTPHAFNQGERQTLDDVLAATLSFQTPLVEVTGGEPLLQPAVLPLMRRLCDAGKTVLIETSGAHDIGEIDRRVHVIMDLKCPDSGETERNHWPNLAQLKPTDEIKFVLASRRDFDWTVETIRERNLEGHCQLLVSGVFGKVSPLELTNWLLDSGLNQVRLQIQLHKLIWDPQARGV